MRERILETAKKERSAHHHHEKSKIQPLTQDYKLGVRRATKSFNQNVWRWTRLQTDETREKDEKSEIIMAKKKLCKGIQLIARMLDLPPFS